MAYSFKSSTEAIWEGCWCGIVLTADSRLNFGVRHRSANLGFTLMRWPSPLGYRAHPRHWKSLTKLVNVSS
jgi:hypothetical protein